MSLYSVTVCTAYVEALNHEFHHIDFSPECYGLPRTLQSRVALAHAKTFEVPAEVTPRLTASTPVARAVQRLSV